MSYQHITYQERVKIEAWKEAGNTNGDMAKFLGRSRSTIGRELSRNKNRYRADRAEKQRKTIRQEANQRLRKIIPGSAMEKWIGEGINKYWSPEQTIGRKRRENPEAASVCHETIYRYIYKFKPEWKEFLRCRKGRYRRRYGTKKMDKRREEAKKKRIDMRPAIVETRSRIGDWEGDTIVGAKMSEHILTHVDRKSGFMLADKVEHATAENVRKITTRRFKKIPKKKRHTVTYDNGSTFEEHAALERDLGIDVYFAYPYHSWERGTNENANGLLRQFVPKGSSFHDISQRKLNGHLRIINTRPRKRHDYLTPQEIYSGCCSLT